MVIDAAAAAAHGTTFCEGDELVWLACCVPAPWLSAGRRETPAVSCDLAIPGKPVHVHPGLSSSAKAGHWPLRPAQGRLTRKVAASSAHSSSTRICAGARWSRLSRAAAASALPVRLSARTSMTGLGWRASSYAAMSRAVRSSRWLKRVEPPRRVRRPCFKAQPVGVSSFLAA